MKELGLNRHTDYTDRASVPAICTLKKRANRVSGTRKHIWRSGDLSLEWLPEVSEKFWIYRRNADSHEAGYSEKEYAVPHTEAGREIPGMNEWASWYCFNRKKDGMYEAELDEAWWWGGGHNDGGTIRTEIPEEWLSLDYGDFLELVVTLSSASHYGFTAEDLKEKTGLKEFFGFEQ